MNPIVEPRIYFIEDVLTMMAKGRLLMPDFQRGYVWGKEQICELFDSIYKGFPIGSVLLWDPEDNVELNASKFIGEHIVAASKDAFYIIDGQQRLTTFFMCLYESEASYDHKWNVYFDLKNEKFIHLKNKKSDAKSHYLELRKVRSTSTFLRELLRIQEEHDDDLLLVRAQNLLDRITKYRLAATELRGGGLEQAIDIFTRLNKEGMKVSEWDYVRALSKKSDSTQLNLLLDGVDKILTKDSFDSNSNSDNSVNLKLIQTAFGFPIYDSAWKQVSDKINNVNELDEINFVLKSLEMTVDFCRDRLCIYDVSHFPYGNQFYMIFGYFLKNRNNLNLNRLENEFYYAALREIPKTNPSSVENLIRYYKSSFDEDILSNKLLSQFHDESIAQLEERFSAKSAKSKILFNIIVRKNKLGNKFDFEDYYYPPKDISKSKEFRDLLGNKKFNSDSTFEDRTIDSLEMMYKNIYLDFSDNIKEESNYF
jgi:uncharacterized protein with ParB-like and HNH nuclease domain